MAGERGIYSLLDMHQDAFNRWRQDQEKEKERRRRRGKRDHLRGGEVNDKKKKTVWSPRKYCGNGVPDWAAVPDKENFPYPLEVDAHCSISTSKRITTTATTTITATTSTNITTTTNNDTRHDQNHDHHQN